MVSKKECNCWLWKRNVIHRFYGVFYCSNCGGKIKDQKSAEERYTATNQEGEKR
jgi:hypothetical protein